VTWRIEYLRSAQKSAGSLDAQTRKRIRAYLHERVAQAEDPRKLAKPLAGRFAPYWRFKVGDYRIICEIQDDRLVVLVIAMGHHRDIYQ
jgi:mRNA interferase RelE/StbE